MILLFFKRKKAIRELTNKVEYDLAFGPPHQSGGSSFALTKAFERGISYCMPYTLLVMDWVPDPSRLEHNHLLLV